MPDISTVKQFAEKYPAFTQAAIRNLIFFEKTNGLAESGAIVRIGSRVRIIDDKWFAWMESGNKKGGAK